jgi:hypothetical protein
VRPAYLELREAGPGLYDVLWKVPALGERVRLSLEVQFPEGTHTVSEPYGLFRGGAYIERWRVQHPDGLAGRRIEIEGLPATRIDTLVRLTEMRGATQTARATPDAPFVTLAAVASRWSVAGTYLGLGVEHILLGIDHLLFVLALLVLVKRYKKLAATITAFTIAHSLTLAAAALDLVRIPGAPVEACIALSIVFVAAEILRGGQGSAGAMARWPWLVAFTFGLLHGLGFAGALSDVGLPRHAIPLALLFFNLGVEIGQLLFVAAVLSVLALVPRFPLSRRPAWLPLSAPYAIGGVAMFWVIQRIAAF